MTALMLLGGGLLLYFGAEWFVGGASALALRLRIPQIIVGLTVVAYGTSAPEIIVGIESAASGHGEVALGNVVGSNVANLGLILGVATLLRPARVDKTLQRRELPMLVGSCALLPLLLWDGAVSASEGLVLLAVAVAYTAWMVRSVRRALTLAEVKETAKATVEAASAAGAPAAQSWRRAAVVAGAGLLVLLVGGQLFVHGAVELARLLGMSERLVGLTIVAVGTSLPELVTSVIATLRGHSDVAVGNVVGSNIFNVLLCLGAAALSGNLVAPFASLRLDLLAVGLLTALGAYAIRTERSISRAEGALLLVLYLAYTALVVRRG